MLLSRWNGLLFEVVSGEGGEVVLVLEDERESTDEHLCLFMLRSTM
jgi:hypothetical protein